MNRTLLYLSLLILAFSSCNNEKKPRKTLLPHVIGGMNDVVVIMSTNHWDGASGDTLRRTLLLQVPGIPQDERLFDLVWMPYEAMDQGIKKQRNIIVTKIGPDYKPKVQIRRSLWAQSQIVVQVMAPTPEAFAEVLAENSEKIISQIQQAELERLMDSYKGSPESTIIKKLAEEYKVKLTVPKGYSVNLEDEDFIWLDSRHRNVIEGILVYSYPYTDTNTFSTDFLINKRNAILKKYIPGETEGSYPVTESRFPLLASEYQLNGNRYTYEIRGLWHVEKGMAMGGSFMSISQYDEARKRIVTVDGFLFAPGEEKRNLLKRLDAIIYSLDFPEVEKE